jgi:hypothetical protein
MIKNKWKLSAIAGALLAARLAVPHLSATPRSGEVGSGKIKHVLLISIDGMHVGRSY